MMIAMGADHGGFALKEVLKAYLTEKGIETVDYGTYNGTDSVDYPVYAKAVCEAIQKGECDLGILVCGTGIGISIAANKMKGIRCAHLCDPLSASLTRQHNNANVIALGGRITGDELAKAIVDAWLSAEYQGGRHQNRIDLISALED